MQQRSEVLAGPRGESANGASREHTEGAVGLRSVLEHTTTLAAAAAGLIGVVYVIGGAVMWIRFQTAGLPADQAVALVPKSDLLVIGLRVMILPAVLASALFLTLARRHGRQARRLEEKRARLASASERNGGVSELEAEIDELEACLKGERARKRLWNAGIAIGAVGLAFVVPLSFGAYAWPLVTFALFTYWGRLRRDFSPTDNERGFLMRLAVAIVIGSAVISVARQLDPPVRLSSVTIELAGKAADDPITGILVTATDRHVVLGDVESGTVESYPRTKVKQLEVGPPLDQRAPPESLVSHIFNLDAWAFTPLELWCGGQDYGWSRVGDLCEGDPTVEERHLRLRNDLVRGLSIECPPEADVTCRGFVSLETVETWRDRRTGKRLPVKTEPVPFNVADDESAAVPLSVDDERLKRFLPERDEVAVWVSLTLDRAGDAVVFREARTLVLASQVRSDASELQPPERDLPTESENDESSEPADPPEPTEDPPALPPAADEKLVVPPDQDDDAAL